MLGLALFRVVEEESDLEEGSGEESEESGPGPPQTVLFFCFLSFFLFIYVSSGDEG